MISHIHIENIAVIEKADIDLFGGLTALTGETGSGKSIIIDSLNFLLGERSAGDLMRTGASKAVVSAEFTDVDPEVRSIFEKLDIDFDPGEVIIQRSISSDGRSSARINGFPVTVSVLREVGALLISFHGQHENNSLLDMAKHVDYLDAYARDIDILTSYKKAFSEVLSLSKELADAEKSLQNKETRIEILKYEIEEIKSAELIENTSDGTDEEQNLLRQRAVVSNREKIIDSVNSVLGILESEENGGVLTMLSSAEKELNSVSRIDPFFSELSEKTNGVYQTASELLSDIRSYLFDNFSDSDGISLESIDDRLDLIRKLKHKYGNSLAEINQYCKSAEDELATLEASEDYISELNETLRSRKKQLKNLALELSESRHSAASTLETAVTEQLKYLDMQNASFICKFTAGDYHEFGNEKIEFLISANIGEAPKSLARIASGGEMSRIMLAIKAILVSFDNVGSLIFDEIDTGVSGRAANRIAEKLKTMSSDKQIITVTHLPQIAAIADNHFLVSKSSDGERTFTNIDCLENDGRINEIARIIGGDKVTDSVYAAAKEMLMQNDIH